MTADPELVRDLYSIADPDMFGTAAPPSFDVLLGAHSLLLLPGREHLSERRLLRAPFCPRALGAWGQIMVEATRSSFADLAVDQPFTAIDRCRRLTLRVITRAVFGVADPAVSERFVAVVEEMMRLFRPIYLLGPVARRRALGFAEYQAAYQRFDALLLEQIRQARRDRRGRRDVLALLLDACDDQGRALSDEAIRDELRTMMIGGHETTAVSMAWAIYYIHRDPGLRERIIDELYGLGLCVGADDGSAATLGGKSRWLTGAIDEALRIRPAAGQVYRKLAKPLALGPWQLPAGVVVSPVTALIHHRPDLYPEPERFDPTRFFEQRPNSSCYMPFGGGAYRCLGADFARMEMITALAILVSEFDFDLLETGPVPWKRIGLTLGPEGGIRMRRSPGSGMYFRPDIAAAE